MQTSGNCEVLREVILWHRKSEPDSVWCVVGLLAKLSGHLQRGGGHLGNRRGLHLLGRGKTQKRL